MRRIDAKTGKLSTGRHSYALANRARPENAAPAKPGPARGLAGD